MSLGPYDDYVSYKNFTYLSSEASSTSGNVYAGSTVYGLTVAGGAVSTDYSYPVVEVKFPEPATINNPQWGYNTLLPGRI